MFVVLLNVNSENTQFCQMKFLDEHHALVKYQLYVSLPSYLLNKCSTGVHTMTRIAGDYAISDPWSYSIMVDYGRF